jgi:hypothetical protein
VTSQSHANNPYHSPHSLAYQQDRAARQRRLARERFEAEERHRRQVERDRQLRQRYQAGPGVRATQAGPYPAAS